MGRTLKARNPRTGRYDHEFVAPDPEELTAVCRRLRGAQPAWVERGLEGRLEVLGRWVDALDRHRPALAEALSRDTGRWLIALAETAVVRPMLERWRRDAPAVMAETTGRSEAMPAVHYRHQLVAYPLAGVISPWNFPLLLSLVDALPALIAGCAVAIKPSEVTPRFVEPLRRSLEEVPELAGVLALLPGDGETGAALIDEVDLICFTGSVATGRRVGEACARAFVPASLELGGKDPAIVLPGSDPVHAADVLLRASVLASGQACQSIERLYVHESLFEPFVERLVAEARRLEINHPDIHRGVIGPLIFERQGRIIAGQLDDARRRGARVHCGGEVETHGGGLWVRPTVLTGVSHEMAVMREETFGPILPVMRYADVDDAVALANDSDFGLSAAVIGPDAGAAEAVARRLEAGAVSLNDAALTGQMFEAEKHSFKLSGLGGSRMGPAGISRFFRRKALLIQTGEPVSIDAFDEAHAGPGRSGAAS